MPETVEQFATRVKQKYPEYAAVPDVELADRVLKKHPEYKSVIGGNLPGAPPPPTMETSPAGSAYGLYQHLGEAFEKVPQGLHNLAGQISDAGKGKPGGLRTLGHTAAETVKAPVRELAGRPQPGQSVLTAPQGPAARFEGAVSMASGGDPVAGRAALLEGKPGEAAIDFWAVPLATLGAGGLLDFLKPESEPKPAGARANELSYASQGASSAKQVDLPRAYREALPELDRNGLQDAKTVGDLNQTVQRTLTQTENEFNTRLQPIAGTQIVPSGIADALEARAAEYPKQTAEGRAMAKALKARAAEFRKPWSYRDLNQERMNANARTQSFEGRKGSQQMATQRTDADVIADQIVKDRTRDAVYEGMQRYWRSSAVPTGQQVPAYYFSTLKRRQSAMIDIRDALDSRVTSLSNASAVPFGEKIKGGLYASSHGNVGFSSRIANAFSDPAKAANSYVRKGASQTRVPLPAIAGRAAAAAAVPAARRTLPPLDESDIPRP